jgi:alanyl-tRNA synthetase
MKKLILSVFTIVLVGTLSLAAQTLQEKAKALLKPADCGVADYDAFKNSSFSLKEDVLKTDKNYELISNDITRYAKKDKKLTINNVKADIKKLKNVNTSIKSLNDKVTTLTESGKKLATNAASVKPANKVAAASSNTTNSVKAVDLSRDILKGLSGKVNGDMGTLTGLLAKAAKK